VGTPTQAPALAVVPASSACADLARVSLADIGGAGSRVRAATQDSSGGVERCTVEGTLAPAIGFRLVLPTRTWTQRFLQVGCGGLCGNIPRNAGAADGCLPLDDGGFAVAGTDMGHAGMASDFGRDPRQRVDFAYRGVHLTALAAKRLIEAFYGRKPAFSYFDGCSDGGREALIEAQRFPQDFNGIVAGAPALNFQVQNALYHAWQARSNRDAQGQAILVAARLPILHRAVLAQCDALDGLVDGLVSDPRACHFDPATVQCPDAGDAKDGACPSAAEVAAARRLYDGPRDPATGQRLIVAGPQPGSELAWAGVFVPRAADEPVMSDMIALGVLRDLAFETKPPADFKLADLHFDARTFDLLRARHALFDATDPDLGAFAAAHGKLILWHGWADPHISPMNTVAYQEAARTLMGDDRLSSFERLYLLPGVWHCGGGEGPSSVDLLTPMMAWVEQGVAPQAIVARQPDPARRPNGFGQPNGGRPLAGGPVGGPGGARRGPPPFEMTRAAPDPRTLVRVIYPYPYVAAYDGHGDPNAPASYVARLATTPNESLDWAGADFYKPYPARQQ